MKRGRKKKSLYITILILGIGAVLFVVQTRALPAQVARELELARRDGIPITPDDFLSVEPISEAENSLADYKALEPKLERLQTELAQARTPGRFQYDFDDPSFRKRLAAVFAANAQLIAQIESLVRRPLDIHEERDPGSWLVGPYRVVRIFSLKTFLDGFQPTAEAAIHDLSIQSNAASQLAQRGSLVATSQVSLGLPFNALVNIVCEYSNEPDALEAAERLVDTLDSPQGYVRPIALQLSSSRQRLERIRLDQAPIGDDVNYREAVPSSRLTAIQDLWELDIVRYARHQVELIGHQPLSLADAVARFRTAEARLDEGGAIRGQFGADYQARTGVADALCSRLARIRLLRQYIAMLRERNRTGKFPSALPKSGPDSVDPFTNEPLRLVLRKQGFIVYSLGRNHIDGGGKSDQVTGDLAFEYPVAKSGRPIF